VSVQRHVYKDAPATAEACAQHIFATLEEAIAARPYATLALSGGSTPKLLFECMAAAKFQWERVHLFWVDERPVPPTDEHSNYRLAEEWLIKPAGIPSNQIHRIHSELDPTAAADMYVDAIRNFFKLQPGELPKFDVIQRGMGPDAHTASLFPGEPMIADREKIAAAVRVEKLSQWRITLLPATLLAAHHTAVLVAGEDKAAAVRSVFEKPYDPKQYPAQIGMREGRDVVWFLDREAAQQLKA
jgi:6-phosphogluconolactonase